MEQIIKVDQSIRDYARKIAEGRVNSKSDKIKTKWNYNWFGDPIEHHMIGAIGEICFSIAYYGQSKTDENFHAYGDLKDFVSKDNKTIDVKTATWNKKNVYLKISKREFEHRPKDVYVLVQYLEQKSECIIVGWANREEVSKTKVTSFGYEDVYAIEGKDLRSSYYKS